MPCPLPPPGEALRPLLTTWPAGRVIHRLHDRQYPPEQFNPGVSATGTLQKPTRFAPIRDDAGVVVPYLYSGSTLDCAIFETIFHDVPLDLPDKFVDLTQFAGYGHSQLVARRDLVLVDLTTDGLSRLNVAKAALIDSMAADYPATARWAQALHHACSTADGLLWMSRRRDRDQALMLFGDRVGPDLAGSPIGPPLPHNRRLLDQILDAADRAGIDVSLT